MSSLIPKRFIQELVDRTDIISVIGARISLNKRGKTYTCRCPFHDEKTPSFSVSAEKKFYYCFGCGAHGNAIGFLMAYHRMEFLDAVEHLAAQLGLDIPRESQTDQQKSRACRWRPTS